MKLKDALYQLKDGEAIIDNLRSQLKPQDNQSPVVITQSDAIAILDIIESYTRLMLQQEVGAGEHLPFE